MPYTNALTKLSAVAAAFAAELAVIQTSATVAEWAGKNVALIGTIAGVVFGYGKLHNRMERVERDVAAKASNEKVDLMDRKLDTIHTDVRQLRDYLMEKR